MIDIRVDATSEAKLRNTLYVGALRAVGNTLYALSGDIKKTYDQYTPKLTGALRRNVSIKISEEGSTGRIAFNYRQPYAHYQYVNHFQNYSTPNTGGEWDKVAEAEVKQKIADEYKKQLKNTFG